MGSVSVAPSPSPPPSAACIDFSVDRHVQDEGVVFSGGATQKLWCWNLKNDLRDQCESEQYYVNGASAASTSAASPLRLLPGCSAASRAPLFRLRAPLPRRRAPAAAAAPRSSSTGPPPSKTSMATTACPTAPSLASRSPCFLPAASSAPSASTSLSRRMRRTWRSRALASKRRRWQRPLNMRFSLASESPKLAWILVHAHDLECPPLLTLSD